MCILSLKLLFWPHESRKCRIKYVQISAHFWPFLKSVVKMVLGRGENWKIFGVILGWFSTRNTNE